MVFVLGLIASALVVVMSLTIKRDMIVKMSALMGIVTTAQYALLGEWSATWLTSVAFFYALGLMFAKKFPIMESKRIAFVLLLIYSAGFFIINGFSLSWPLLAYGASLLGTFMLLVHNPLILKNMMLINGLLWLGFQLASGAYGQIPGEIIYLFGVITSITYLMKAKSKGIPLDKVPEFTTILKRKLEKRKRNKLQVA